MGGDFYIPWEGAGCGSQPPRWPQWSLSWYSHFYTVFTHNVPGWIIGPIEWTRSNAVSLLTLDDKGQLLLSLALSHQLLWWNHTVCSLVEMTRGQAMGASRQQLCKWAWGESSSFSFIQRLQAWLTPWLQPNQRSWARTTQLRCSGIPDPRKWWEREYTLF